MKAEVNQQRLERQQVQHSLAQAEEKGQQGRAQPD